MAQRFLTPENLASLAQHFHVSDANALFASVGEGNTSPQAVVHQLIALMGGDEAITEATLSDAPIITGHPRRMPTSSSGVIVDGDPGLYVKLAKCCMPVPGDEIIGFVTRGDGVSVHRADCTNVRDLERSPERFVKVEWGPTADAAYLVAIQVEGIDRAGLLSDVTRVLSEMHMNILSASATTTKDRVFTIRLSFETPDPRHLDNVVAAIKRVSGVYDVSRVRSS